MSMHIDNETYPLESITEFAQYNDVKPPERDQKMKSIKAEPEESQNATNDPEKPTRNTYRKYKDEDKEKFFYYYTQTDMSTRAIAKKLNIPQSTTQTRVSQDKEDPQDIIMRRPRSGRPVGRPPLLDETHEKFLINLVDENASIVLDDMMDSLTNEFEGLSLPKTALYNFVTEK
ncbi:hypothetical protein K501DRAFT_288820, partial [Backusella circina FSU 941]